MLNQMYNYHLVHAEDEEVWLIPKTRIPVATPVAKSVQSPA